MDTILKSVPLPEADPAYHRRRGQEVDARGTDQATRMTLEGLADVDAGRLIDDKDMTAWGASLGTENELPPPQSR
jgi:predicted transcriptional regulator